MTTGLLVRGLASDLRGREDGLRLLGTEVRIHGQPNLWSREGRVRSLDQRTITPTPPSSPMNGSLTPSSGSASALSSLLASSSSKNDGRATSPPASSSSFAPPPPPDSSSSPHQPPMAHAPLTLHAISTLYHSTPPIDASVLRPILQVLYEDEQDWQSQPPHRCVVTHPSRSRKDLQGADRSSTLCPPFVFGLLFQPFSASALSCSRTACTR